MWAAKKPTYQWKTIFGIWKTLITFGFDFDFVQCYNAKVQKLRIPLIRYYVRTRITEFTQQSSISTTLKYTLFDKCRIGGNGTTDDIVITTTHVNPVIIVFEFRNVLKTCCCTSHLFGVVLMFSLFNTTLFVITTLYILFLSYKNVNENYYTICWNKI